VARMRLGELRKRQECKSDGALEKRVLFHAIDSKSAGT
jgi:hypothetical protein